MGSVRLRPIIHSLLMKNIDLPSVNGVTFTRSILDAFKVAIAEQIIRLLPSLTIDAAYDGVDYAKRDGHFMVALPRYKVPGDMVERATTYKRSFVPTEWLEDIQQSGAVLIFTCCKKSLAERVLNQVHSLTWATPSGKPEYGMSQEGSGKTILIEYSSPNIAKQFHVGHIRSTIIGGFLANIYKACGWNVVSLNYLGDWGKQCGLVALGYDKFGNAELYEREGIRHLQQVYVQISAAQKADPEVDLSAKRYFKRMEDGDRELLAQWRKWREDSISQYSQDYKALNIEFDIWCGESLVSTEAQMAMVAAAEALGHVVQNDKGVKEFPLGKHGLKNAPLFNIEGATLYLTRDIVEATARYEKYKFDKLLYVVSTEQDTHLAQLFKILSLLGYTWADRLEHIRFGKVLGMSTRRGTVQLLADVITEAKAVMKEQMMKNETKFSQIENPDEVSCEVGITAMKIQDLQMNRVSDYSFSWTRMTSFEGDTGPYLQYAHVRLCSIERKNPEMFPLPPLDQCDISLLDEPQAQRIIFQMASYPDAVRTALRNQESSGIVGFCMKLAHAISSAWNVLQVKSCPQLQRAQARLWLFLLARDVLAAGMRLLTLNPLERM